MLGNINITNIRNQLSPVFCHIEEYSKAINTTNNPYLFFGSLNNKLSALTFLSKYENYPLFQCLPSDDFSNTINNLDSIVNDFLDRCFFFYESQPFSSSAAKHSFRSKYFDYLYKSFLSQNAFWYNTDAPGSQPIRLYTNNNYARIVDYIRNEISLNSKIKSYKDSIAISSLLEIDNMDGDSFERWSESFLCKLGFHNIVLSGKSGDQGVDIFAEKDGVRYAIQCKCYSSDLGNEPVQQVFAGKNHFNCHVGAVLTNRHFTAGGKELASSLGVLLWDRDWIKNKLSDPPNISHSFYSYDGDEMTPVAFEVILEDSNCSVSLLQRRLKLGYARAARIIDELEQKGFVGPFQGSKPRDIYVTKEIWDIVK